MAVRILRCPYCVLGNDFRPMLRKREGWFICSKCGHRANPGLAHFTCCCKKCEKLNRAA
jgi:hypothetical protein